MSKEVLGFLLNKRISGLKTVKQKKAFLANCVDKNLIELPKVEIEVDERVKVNVDDVCGACSSDVYYTNHERVCKSCGISTKSNKGTKFRITDTSNSKGSGSFIEPGTVIITIRKNGKTYQRDLSVINTWLSVDPEEQKFVNSAKKINDVLDSLANMYSPIKYDSVRADVISMWYNIYLFNPDIRGNERLALQSLSVYYSFMYNELNINIQKLSGLFQIKMSDIMVFNPVMISIFKDTAYSKFITLTVGVKCEIQIPENIKRQTRIVERDMKDYFKSPPTSREYSGMIYYLSKLLKIKMLPLLFWRLNVHQALIRFLQNPRR